MAEKRQDVNIVLKVLNETKGGVQAALNDFKIFERGLASVNTTLGSMGTLIGVGLGFAGISATIAGGVQKFIEYDEAMDAVGDALEAFGDKSESSRTRAKEFGIEIGNLAHLSGPAIINMQALGVTIGGLTGDKLEAATRAAVGLSKGLGVDLDTAMKAVSKASIGSTKDLAKLGIVVDENATATEKYYAVLEKGEKLFAADTAGAATFKEQIDDLKKAAGELTVTLGEVVNETLGDSSKGKGFLSELKADLMGVKEIVDYLRNRKPGAEKSGVETVVDTVGTVAKYSSPLGMAYDKFLDYAGGSFRDAADAEANKNAATSGTTMLRDQGRVKDAGIIEAGALSAGTKAASADIAQQQKQVADLYRDAAGLTEKSAMTEAGSAEDLIKKRKQLLEIQGKINAAVVSPQKVGDDLAVAFNKSLDAKYSKYVEKFNAAMGGEGTQKERNARGGAITAEFNAWVSLEKKKRDEAVAAATVAETAHKKEQANLDKEIALITTKIEKKQADAGEKVAELLRPKSDDPLINAKQAEQLKIDTLLKSKDLNEDDRRLLKERRDAADYEYEYKRLARDETAAEAIANKAIQQDLSDFFFDVENQPKVDKAEKVRDSGPGLAAFSADRFLTGVQQTSADQLRGLAERQAIGNEIVSRSASNSWRSSGSLTISPRRRA